MKVLIADDDALLRQMLQAQLANAGHEFVFASDGMEAWELLQREAIRMVIVDWMMPKLDGPDLIRRIRDAGWPGYTYIILLTAKSDRDDIVEGLNLGADDYVTKPFRHDELLARMGVGARILQLEKRLSESLAREEALATRDGLTGLPNRRALTDLARVELSRAARARTSVGLIVMDLDHFKRINDEFGHAAGDKTLQQVAEVLQKNKRDYDFTGAGAARSSSSCFRARPFPRRRWSPSESGRPSRRCASIPGTPGPSSSTPAWAWPAPHRSRRPWGSTISCGRPTAPCTVRSGRGGIVSGSTSWPRSRRFVIQRRTPR